MAPAPPVESNEPIAIRSAEDIARRRRELIALLWGEPALPSTQPEVTPAIEDEAWSGIASLARIDRLLVRMDLGFTSEVYYFVPKRPNGALALYHQGHEGDFVLGRKVIVRLIDAGYSVAAFAMPLKGRNPAPSVRLGRLGTLPVSFHEHMKFVSPERGHPVKFFIEPVIAVLNHLAPRHQRIAMIGISGGGWTTTLAAAVDLRIARSFPVAGSYPLYLRWTGGDWGDYEQTAPEIYTRVNYMELYVLGAYGPGRKQLQVINLHDPCCFGGTGSDTYKDRVRARVAELGAGEYDLFLDDTHREHAISTAAMDRILAELAADRSQ